MKKIGIILKNQFNYALKGNTATFSSSFDLNTNWNSNQDKPNSIQFRFKTDGIPTGSGAYTQSLFVADGNYAAPDYTLGMILEYDQTLVNSGSYSGAVASVSQSYGELSFFPNGIVNVL